jgi:hypothetical protein
MPKRNDITIDRVLSIIQKYDSPRVIMISDVARVLCCDWVTAKRHIEKHKETREAFTSKVEEALDEAEKTLFDIAVGQTNISALKYLLSTKGKHRGYALPMVSGQLNMFDPKEGEEQSDGGLFVLDMDKMTHIEAFMKGESESLTDFQSRQSQPIRAVENGHFEVLESSPKEV